MIEELASILPSTAGLGAAALIALALTFRRGNVEAQPDVLRSTVRLVLLTVFLQAVHFGEELGTGFHERFPRLLGFRAWSVEFFVVFNVSWLAIWCLSALGLSRRVHAALFPIWFLAIACVLNAVAHPLFSLSTGGYFPGLISSPLVGVAGILLLRRLSQLTGGAATRAAAGAGSVSSP